MNMYDIHMHIIPGVDDGSWNMDMSKQLLYMAYEQGIRKIMATPHSSAFEESEEEVKERFKQLQDTSVKILPDMQIYLGCEIRCDRLCMDNVLEGLRSHRIPTLNGTGYVLAEFAAFIEPEEALECVKGLLDAGWRPVLAHVERYDNLLKEAGWIEKLQNAGCLFQMNVYSVYDEEDEGIKSNALSLMKEKRIAFLGSDAHRTIFRPPSVKYGLQYLYDHYDRKYVDQISFENAGRLLKMERNISGTKMPIPKII